MGTRVHSIKVSRSSIINNNFLIVDEESRDAVFVDPAWELDTLENALEQNQATLKGILVTHSHPDHTDLCDTLSKLYSVPVFMNQTEIDFYSFHCAGLVALQNEDLFKLGKLKIKPHATPGHTIGGVCYQIDSSLFTGDTLFIEGCGMCVGPGSDPYQLFLSLQKLKQSLDPTTCIYPGHTYVYPCGKSLSFLLKNNIYLAFDDIEMFVEFRMRKNQNSLFKFI
ncbi:MBL fold metallo-hydrolase [Microbulbifer sp. ZKSA006]|uniref:MBL fold metallo-hydrolase n=1 Tax=Microbulbifer sp. ZKSA006 TaxID=3243390 RepID=UPI0040395D68